MGLNSAMDGARKLRSKRPAIPARPREMPAKWRVAIETFGVCVGITAIVANWVAIQRWAGFEKPVYQVSASAHDLPLGVEATLTLTGYYKSGEPAQTNGYTCYWDKPSGIDLISDNQDCEAQIRPLQALFVDGKTSFAVTIGVIARSAAGNPISTRPAEVTIYNFSRPIIDTDPVVPFGSDRKVAFHLPGSSSAPIEHCVWLPGYVFATPETCETTLAGAKMPQALRGRDQDITVILRLRNQRGKIFSLQSDPFPIRFEGAPAPVEQNPSDLPAIARKSVPPASLFPAPTDGDAERQITRPPKFYVVLNDVAALRTPNPYGDHTGDFQAGESVAVIASPNEDWLQVRSGDGVVGYIRKSNLGDQQ